MKKSDIPIRRSWVLVGAGNAHLPFVRSWGMRPEPGVALTLVDENEISAYSAMVPGYIAGQYSRALAFIDLVQLCAAHGVIWIRGKVTRIDAAARRLEFADRPPLDFDVLSLNLGSEPEPPPGDLSAVIRLRPLRRFVEQLDALGASLGASGKIAIAGGGASGCEIALALRRRLPPTVQLDLYHAGSALLPEFPPKASDWMEKALRDGGVGVRTNATVKRVEGRAAELSDGEWIAFDRLLWATRPAPPVVLRASGLPVDDQGYVRVDECLRVEGLEGVFAAGDCATMARYPWLPKNGVYAVRQGRVIGDNLRQLAQGRRLQHFRPPRRWLALLTTSDGRAIFRYGGLVLRGRWAARLKARIDARWRERFEVPPLPSDAEPEPMRCGGCGAKVPSDVLQKVLHRLDLGATQDPRFRVGPMQGEDVSVHQPLPGLEVQSVDFFRAFVPDLFLFGRLAALHALSDLQAKNVTPYCAQAIVTVPEGSPRRQEAQLFEMLSGALQEFRRLNVLLAGGHSGEGAESAMGFAVTGYAASERWLPKRGFNAGDALILTKPLGSGALLAALGRGRCRAGWYEALISGMLADNAAAARWLDEAGASACTDVTGFGLAGHLLEMLADRKLTATLYGKQVPVYSGFKEVTEEGIFSSLQPGNLAFSRSLEGESPYPAWLFDPQTCGGLLAGVSCSRADELVTTLRGAGYPHAAVIGEITGRAEHLSAPVRVR